MLRIAGSPTGHSHRWAGAMRRNGGVGKFLTGVFVVLAVTARAGLIVHLPLDAGSNAIPAGKAPFVRGIVGDAAVIRPTGEGLVIESCLPALNLSDLVSIGCWFRTERPPDEEVLVVAAGGCRLAVAKGSGSASFAVKGVKGMLAGIAAASKASGYSNICDGRWHHLVGLYDGKALSLYVDGDMEELVDASGKIVAPDLKIVMGRMSRPSAQPANAWLCCIDDIQIYDEALDYAAIFRLAKRASRQVETAGGRKVDLRRDFLDKGVIPIQAHRGGGLSLPENTLETYRETWAMGMIPEADIRTIKDGVIICMHDSDLRRLSPAVPAPWKTMPFEAMTIERIKSFDVGAFRGRPGQKVPTLEEVFRDMQGRPERMLELDYKQIDLGQLAGLIAKHGLRNQVIFVTRYHHLIRQWQRVSPQAMTLLWMGGTEHALGRMFEQLRRDGFAGISIIQIILFKDASADGFRPSISYLRQRQLELAGQGIALQLIPWEISDQAVFEKLLAAGFRFFGTDHPQTALAAYKQMARRELRD